MNSSFRRAQLLSNRLNFSDNRFYLNPAVSSLLGSRKRVAETTRFASNLVSHRELAEIEDRIGKSVNENVLDDLLGKNIGDLNILHKKIAVSEAGDVHILLNPPTLLHPQLVQLKEKIREHAQMELNSWLQSKNRPTGQLTVKIEAVPTRPRPFMSQFVDKPEQLEDSLGPGLANVTHILAVYSCKGGVGKSTVAVNLAYELSRRGGRVGILDVDIYGPSLPYLISPEDKTVRSSPKGSGMVYPIEHKGVKALSLGYVAVKSGVPGSGENNGAAVMRGPLAGRVVSQLLKGTDWDDLDVLILDLPPGTGDVQLAVCQDVQLSGAVAVTTPSRLAVEDTKKGIDMFTSMGVPVLSVVENMSYFVCENGLTHYPFGKGVIDGEALESALDVPQNRLVKLPISPLFNGDGGCPDPIALQRPAGEEVQLEAFSSLADVVSGELLKVFYGQTEQDQAQVLMDGEPFSVGSLHVEKTSGGDDCVTIRLFSDEGAVQRFVSGKRLRATNPKTGLLLEGSPFAKDLSAEDVRDDLVVDSVVSSSTSSTRGKRSPSILPVSVDKKGRYGYAVEFSDGGTIIYTLLSLAMAAGGIPSRRE